MNQTFDNFAKYNLSEESIALLMNNKNLIPPDGEHEIEVFERWCDTYLNTTFYMRVHTIPTNELTEIEKEILTILKSLSSQKIFGDDPMWDYFVEREDGEIDFLTESTELYEYSGDEEKIADLFNLDQIWQSQNIAFDGFFTYIFITHYPRLSLYRICTSDDYGNSIDYYYSKEHKIYVSILNVCD